MKHIFIILLIILSSCIKEHSCEGCKQKIITDTIIVVPDTTIPPIIDTVKPPTVDTIPPVVDTIPIDTLPYVDTSTYFVYFDTLILNNKKISHISLQVLNNSLPNFWTFTILNKIEGQETWRYSDNTDVSWLMEYMPRGDTAYFRMAVVYRVNGIPNFREEFSPIVGYQIKR